MEYNTGMCLSKESLMLTIEDMRLIRSGVGEEISMKPEELIVSPAVTEWLIENGIDTQEKLDELIADLLSE